MMPAFNYSRYSAIFFIAYLAIELYFLMNLVGICLYFDTEGYSDSCYIQHYIPYLYSFVVSALRYLPRLNLRESAIDTVVSDGCNHSCFGLLDAM